MLQKLRAGVGSWAAKIILFILMASFALWGIDGYVGTGGDDGVAATVGERQIAADALGRAYRAMLNRRDLAQIDVERARELRLAEPVLERMIGRALLAAEARSGGLDAGDDRVRDAIIARPEFRDGMNMFSRLAFEQYLRAVGESEQTYTESVRDDIALSALGEAAFGGATVPEVFVARILAWLGETRSAQIMTLPAQSMPSPPDPGEGELAAFLADHADLFMRPEYRRLSYISISPTELAAETSLGEGELRAVYDARLAEFTQPESRHILQLLVADEETAKTASARLTAGEDFAAVAEALAGQAPGAGDLGWLVRDAIPDPALAEAAFTLPEGGVSPPLSGAFGWFVVSVAGIRPASTRPFAEVAPELRQDMALETALDTAYDLSVLVDESLGAGHDLETAATAVNLPLRSLAGIDRNGLTPAGAPPEPSPPGGPAFTQAAFAAEEGATGFLVETGDEGYFVLRVDGITPAHLPELATIRADVLAAWQREQRLRMMQERAQRIVDALDAGADFSRAAQDAGLQPPPPVQDIARFGRDGRSRGDAAGGSELTLTPQIEALPRGLAADLFNLQPGKGTFAETATGDVTIARLEAIHPIQSTAESPELLTLQREVRESLRAGMEATLLAEYTTALRARHPVTVNRAVLDRLY